MSRQRRSSQGHSKERYRRHKEKYGMFGHSYENVVELCVQSAMTSVRNMTTDQLNELLYSDARIDSIIDNLSQVRSLPAEREADLAQNKSLAEWNLAQEPRLETLKGQVLELHEKAQNLKKEAEEMNGRLGSLSSERSLETMANLLQVAAKEVEDDAETVAEKFIEGETSYPLFLNDFLSKKTLAHSRKVKSDRLNTILREQQYAPQTAARPPSMPNFPSNIPYPDASRHSFW